MRDDAIRSSSLGLAAIGGLFFVLIDGGTDRRTSHIAADRRADRSAGRLLSRGRPREIESARPTSWPNVTSRDDEIGSLARAVHRFRTYAAELEILNQRFDTVLANLPQGVESFDERDKLVVANRRYAELYGLGEPSPLIGLSLSGIAAKREAIFGMPITGADDKLRDQLRGVGSRTNRCVLRRTAEWQDPFAQRRAHAGRRLACDPSRHHRAPARRSRRSPSWPTTTR